jgi:hypothetical protein
LPGGTSYVASAAEAFGALGHILKPHVARRYPVGVEADAVVRYGEGDVMVVGTDADFSGAGGPEARRLLLAFDIHVHMQELASLNGCSVLAKRLHQPLYFERAGAEFEYQRLHLGQRSLS